MYIFLQQLQADDPLPSPPLNSDILLTFYAASCLKIIMPLV